MPNPIYQSSRDSGCSMIILSDGDCYFGSNDNDDGESDTADNDNVTIKLQLYPFSDRGRTTCLIFGPF